MEHKSMMRYGKLTDHFSQKSRIAHVPFSGTFELTPLCNMNCKMCYIRMTKQEMDRVGTALQVEDWLRIAKEAVEQGMVLLLLTGGEAILHKDFKRIFQETRKMGLFLAINTNATLINDDWIEFFKQNPGAQFNITIYGGSNETYNRLCRNPFGFDQMKAAVEKLQAANQKIHLNATFSKQNVEDMEAVYEFGRAHNLVVHANTYCFPPVRKEGVVDPEEDRFTSEEAARARVRLNWNSFNDENKFIAFAKRTITDLEHATPEEDCGSVEGERVRCAAGRANFWITWDGRMLPCGMIPDSFVSIKEHNFKESWDRIVADTDKIRLTPECVNCKYKKLCLPCAAKITAETGTYSGKAEYLCAYQKEYIRLLGEAVKYLEQENH